MTGCWACATARVPHASLTHPPPRSCYPSERALRFAKWDVARRPARQPPTHRAPSSSATQGGGQLGVRDGKRTVIVQVSHIGVEPDLLRSAEGMAPAVSLTPTVPRRASASDVHTMSDTAEDVKAEASLLAHLALVRQGKTLVVGVDEMERAQGSRSS